MLTETRQRDGQGGLCRQTSAVLRVFGGLSCLLVMVLLSGQPAWAMEFYSFVDHNGVLHLSDRPTDPRYRPVRTVNRYKEEGGRSWPVVRVPVVSRSHTSLQNAEIIASRSSTQRPASAQRPPASTQRLVSVYYPDRPAPPSARPAPPLARYAQPLARYAQPSDISRGAVIRPESSSGPASARQREPFADIIYDAARRNGLSVALLRSVIRVESDFDPDAVSPKGAVGLMQLMPGTAQMYGVQDSTDPDANVQGGARFLAALLKRFDDDLELALAAYNAGPGAVIRHGRTIPPYPETQHYVARVLRYYHAYR